MTAPSTRPLSATVAPARNSGATTHEATQQAPVSASNGPATAESTPPEWSETPAAPSPSPAALLAEQGTTAANGCVDPRGTQPLAKPYRVLVACEFSGIVRDAFRAKGHDAYSCDVLPTEGDPAYHFQCDITTVLRDRGSRWDLMIAHPPCTHLSVSGARWFKDKLPEQAEALDFVRMLMAAPVERIAIENPISIISSRIRKPDQIVQPWMFGHGETKATCLWLKGLPKLQATNIVEGRIGRVFRMPPSPDRWKERSRTYTGIAQAMASQWGAA